MKAEKTLKTIIGQMTAKAEAEAKREGDTIMQNKATRRRRYKVWALNERIKSAIKERERNGPPGYMEKLTKKIRENLAYIKQRRATL